MKRLVAAVILIAAAAWHIPAPSMRMDAQIVVLRRGSVPSGGGPATYDAVSNGKCNGPGGGAPECVTGTTLTFSHTTGSGSNRSLDVFCTISGGSATVQPAILTGVHATAQSLSEVATAGANYRIRHWSLANGTQPTSGTNNIVIVLAAGLTTTQSVLSCSAVSTSGVSQTTQFSDSGDAASGADTSAEWSMTTIASGDLGLIAVCNGTSVGTSTNATVRFDATDDGNGACNTIGVATAVPGVSSGVWTVGNDSWLTLTAVKKGG